jgi:hypothetical protein
MRVTYTIFEKSRRGGEYVRGQVAFNHYGRGEDNRLEDRIVSDLQSDYGLDWTGDTHGIRVERREAGQVQQMVKA